jgi:hypothetical protein
MNKCLYCNAVILPPCTNFCNGTCASEYNRKQTPMSDAKQPSIEAGKKITEHSLKQANDAKE